MFRVPESKDPFDSPRTDLIKTYKERFSIDHLVKAVSFFGNYTTQYGTTAPVYSELLSWLYIPTSQEFAKKAYDSIQTTIKKASLNSDETAIWVTSTLDDLSEVYHDMLKKNHKGTTFTHIENILKEYKMPLEKEAYKIEAQKVFSVLKLSRRDIYLMDLERRPS